MKLNQPAEEEENMMHVWHFCVFHLLNSESFLFIMHMFEGFVCNNKRRHSGHLNRLSNAIVHLYSSTFIMALLEKGWD